MDNTANDETPDQLRERLVGDVEKCKRALANAVTSFHAGSVSHPGRNNAMRSAGKYARAKKCLEKATLLLEEHDHKHSSRP